MRKVVAATPAELRPPALHAGGPAAQIVGREAQFARRVAEWSVEQLAPTVPPRDKALFAKLKRALDAKSSTHDQLWAGHFERAGSPAVEAVKLACKARTGGLTAPTHAAQAVLLLHAHLLETNPRAVPAFIEALDDDVLKAEFKAVAYAHFGKRGLSVERVLWRGAAANGTAARWVARATKTTFMLIHKVGKRWVWFEGSRDDVVAHVPKADFEQAVQIIFTRDQPGVFGRMSTFF